MHAILPVFPRILGRRRSLAPHFRPPNRGGCPQLSTGVRCVLARGPSKSRCFMCNVGCHRGACSPTPLGPPTEGRCTSDDARHHVGGARSPSTSVRGLALARSALPLGSRALCAATPRARSDARVVSRETPPQLRTRSTLQGATSFHVKQFGAAALRLHRSTALRAAVDGPARHVARTPPPRCTRS